jgi:hypothetical protein
MQTHNSTNQGIAKGMILHVVNTVIGYPPNRSDVAPSKDIHKNRFFSDQGVRNYEFILTGITSIGGLELEMARSAVLADSECSTNSYVSPWIQN